MRAPQSKASEADGVLKHTDALGALVSAVEPSLTRVYYFLGDN